MLHVERATWLRPASGLLEEVVWDWSTYLIVQDILTLFSHSSDQGGDFVLNWKADWIIKNGELLRMTTQTPKMICINEKWVFIVLGTETLRLFDITVSFRIPCLIYQYLTPKFDINWERGYYPSQFHLGKELFNPKTL